MIRELLSYWPLPEDVAACIKTDAESASEAVFLSVHQHVLFERRAIGSQTNSLPDCDENEFLRAFLEPTLSDGRVIIPLVGSTGSGKSHIVRWINASLRRLPNANRRVIIRIPKGTSLKGVLGLLLKELDEPEYEPFRIKLKNAQEQIEPEQAAGLLCETLAQTLIEKSDSARSLLLTTPGNKVARESADYGKSAMLPTLLRSNELRERHFVRESANNTAPIRRLVEPLAVSRDSNIEDDRKHLFFPEDLNFETVKTDDLGLEQRSAIAQLSREDRRTTAARILNEALDGAKQKLLGIDQTVTDLFDAVRTKLLEQGKELILLVEDFAVLSGIQKQLLQVIIKEAFRDGKQVLCTMRTVLAYTSGYLETATVLTRAGLEYFISDTPGTETDILARIEKLVGAYLNAARNGQDRLEEAYKETPKQKALSEKWIPVFEAPIDGAANMTLKDFDISEDGYELFPFNKAAIRELSLEGCVQTNGQLIYNPRYVIQNVLNKVLLNRRFFEEGTFPSESFRNANRHLPAKVVDEVRAVVPPEDYDRWVRFLSYWGGRPTSSEELAHFSSRVASAFALDASPFKPTGPVESNSSDGRSRKPGGTGSRPNERLIQDSPPIAPVPERDESEIALEKSLEAWRNGLRMGQSDANNLRKLLAEATHSFINWDWDLFKPNEGVPKFFQNVYVPNAQGNSTNTEDGTSTMFAVCTEADLKKPDRSAQICLAILAVHRFHIVHKANWNYPEANMDLPRYTSLIQSFVNRARTFVLARYFRAPFDPIPALVQGLLIGARALGQDPPARGREASTSINSLFAQPLLDKQNLVATTPVNQTSTPSGWEEFLSALRACRIKNPGSTTETWIDHLLNLVGARQGGYPKVYAIDVSRLRLPVEEVADSWTFDGVVPQGGSNELENLRRTHASLKSQSRAIEKEAEALRCWRTNIVSWAGETPDKDALVEKLKATIEQAKAAGLAVGLEQITLVRLVEDFGRSPFKAAFDDVQRLFNMKSKGTVLAVLGANHQPAVELSRELERRFTTFLAGVQQSIQAKFLNLGTDPKTEAIQALRAQVSALVPILKEISEL